MGCSPGRMIVLVDSGSLFSFANLHRHYLGCRKGKRNTYNALRFEARQELNLLELAEALQNRSYRPSSSVCFVTQRPKMREIFAADFKDRIVHHVLVDELERYWEPVFIHDSYACRRGKGIHQAVARLRQFIRQGSGNGQQRLWYLQLDIKNYFMSIDKTVLFSLLKPHINSLDIMWLTKLLVFHDCTQDYFYKGRPGLLQQLPAHKSLLQAGSAKGLPIGNLNSQFFANVYLNALDQFVKHTLKCRYYLRYCDDFVLLSEDPQQLKLWRAQIMQFLAERLLLSLNDKRQKLRPVSDGIDFLGYIVRRDYTLVRKRVVNNLRAKLQGFEAQLLRQRRYYRVYLYDSEVVDALVACLASYLGHLSHADSFNLRQRIWQEFSFLEQYFQVDEAVNTLCRRRFDAAGLRTVLGQYRYFRRCFENEVLFFKVGRFIEFYHAADQSIAHYLGLQQLKPNRRGALWGFPVSMARHYLRMLVNAGWSVVCIIETGQYLSKIQERRVFCLVESF